MGNELLRNLTDLEKLRNIDRETLFSVIEESLLTAARKAVNASREVSVKIDRSTGEIKCWAKLFIVDKVEKPEEQIALREVQAKFPDGNYTEQNIGQEIDWEVTPKDFGRIAAMNAKQMIFQKLRQVEKRNVCSQFKDKLNTLVTGEVRRLEHGEVVVGFDQAEGAMRREDRIPGENFETGDMVTALLVEINEDKPGASLYVSRACPEFVVKLFEREVAEIADGTVAIKAVAREPGYRSKIAVASTDPHVDPVGACVGLRGNRVKMIVRELMGEKVDIINWDADIRKFVENALKPAKIDSMVINEARHSIKIEVPEDQLSLSIGKKGQNARLASKLTGWKLDITASQNKEVSAEEAFENQKRNAIEALSKALELTEEQVASLVNAGFVSAEQVRDAEVSDIAALDGFDEASAEAAVKRAANA